MNTSVNDTGDFSDSEKSYQIKEKLKPKLVRGSSKGYKIPRMNKSVNKRKKKSNNLSMSLNNSVMNKVSLRANNKALAQALEVTRLHLAQQQDSNLELQQECQTLKLKINKLQEVAGVKNEYIEDIVSARVQERLDTIKKVLHEISGQMMFSVEGLSKALTLCAGVPAVHVNNVLSDSTVTNIQKEPVYSLDAQNKENIGILANNIGKTFKPVHVNLSTTTCTSNTSTAISAYATPAVKKTSFPIGAAKRVVRTGLSVDESESEDPTVEQSILMEDLDDLPFTDSEMPSSLDRISEGPELKRRTTRHSKSIRDRCSGLFDRKSRSKDRKKAQSPDKKEYSTENQIIENVDDTQMIDESTAITCVNDNENDTTLVPSSDVDQNSITCPSQNNADIDVEKENIANKSEPKDATIYDDKDMSMTVALDAALILCNNSKEIINHDLQTDNSKFADITNSSISDKGNGSRTYYEVQISKPGKMSFKCSKKDAKSPETKSKTKKKGLLEAPNPNDIDGVFDFKSTPKGPEEIEPVKSVYDLTMTESIVEPPEKFSEFKASRKVDKSNTETPKTNKSTKAKVDNEKNSKIPCLDKKKPKQNNRRTITLAKSIENESQDEPDIICDSETDLFATSETDNVKPNKEKKTKVKKNKALEIYIDDQSNSNTFDDKIETVESVCIGSVSDHEIEDISKKKGRNPNRETIVLFKDGIRDEKLTEMNSVVPLNKIGKGLREDISGTSNNDVIVKKARVRKTNRQTIVLTTESVEEKLNAEKEVGQDNVGNNVIGFDGEITERKANVKQKKSRKPNRQTLVLQTRIENIEEKLAEMDNEVGLNKENIENLDSEAANFQEEKVVKEKRVRKSKRQTLVLQKHIENIEEKLAEIDNEVGLNDESEAANYQEEKVVKEKRVRKSKRQTVVLKSTKEEVDDDVFCSNEASKSGKKKRDKKRKTLIVIPDSPIYTPRDRITSVRFHQNEENSGTDDQEMNQDIDKNETNGGSEDIVENNKKKGKRHTIVLSKNTPAVNTVSDVVNNSGEDLESLSEPSQEDIEEENIYDEQQTSKAKNAAVLPKGGRSSRDLAHVMIFRSPVSRNFTPETSKEPEGIVQASESGTKWAWDDVVVGPRPSQEAIVIDNGESHTVPTETCQEEMEYAKQLSPKDGTFVVNHSDPDTEVVQENRGAQTEIETTKKSRKKTEKEGKSKSQKSKQKSVYKNRQRDGDELLEHSLDANHEICQEEIVKSLKSSKKKKKSKSSSKKTPRREPIGYRDDASEDCELELIQSAEDLGHTKSARKRSIVEIKSEADDLAEIKRPRRGAAANINFKEPKLGSKLRRGDQFTTCDTNIEIYKSKQKQKKSTGERVYQDLKKSP